MMLPHLTEPNTGGCLPGPWCKDTCACEVLNVCLT